ncbi:MAG TPA: LysM peptidoglycan-binding domain-containing protein, partial [Clostridiaceae bacterium]|nr:LysM peptidoglycan-binding domain-containing protein [Clostridiaceae bacterium]
MVVYHTVQPGQTLWSIAQQYGTTIEFILQNNQIANPNNIYPGMVI